MGNSDFTLTITVKQISKKVFGFEHAWAPSKPEFSEDLLAELHEICFSPEPNAVAREIAAYQKHGFAVRVNLA